jgi:hypothetical protein
MENYEKLLQDALETKRSHLDSEVCPKLKRAFGQLRLAFQNFYGILLKKGVIRPDQYRDEKKIQEMTLPSSEPFIESQRSSQMSIRIAELDSLYDYLHMFFDFSADNISLRSLKKISDILRYIEWKKFAVNNEHYMTQTLALLVAQTHSDNVSERLLQDLAKQMAAGTREALEQVKELTDYQKQKYKVTVRELFFDKVTFEKNLPYHKAQENFLTQIRKQIGKDGGVVPFYKDLIVEACDEVYSSRADNLQAAVLSSLEARTAPREAVKKKKVVEKNPKESLFLAFFELGRSAASLEGIMTKLNYNNDIYIKHGLSFGQKFLLFLKNFIRGHSDVIYRTSFTDPNTGTKYDKNIVFAKLMERLDDRIKVLSRFAANTSPAYKKLNEVSDKQAEDLLNRQINETRELLTDCLAMDSFFRKFTSGSKAQAKGLKIEITAVRHLIGRAIELRHEYLSEKDTSAGLKNLGL